MDKLTNIFGQQLPEQLYHYTNTQGLLGILKSNQLWATQIDYLNDTEEFKIGKKVVQKVYSEKKARSKNTTFFTHLEKFGNIFEGEDVFITSLCEDGDLLSQWRGYGGGIGGYSLAINTNHRKFSHSSSPDLGENLMLLKCFYDPKQLRAMALDLLNKCIYGWEESEKRLAGTNTVDNAQVVAWRIYSTIIAACLKHHSFREENEWRLIRTTRVHKELRFREGASSLIPYVELNLKGAKGNDLNLIREMIVGPRPDLDLARKSLQKFLDSQIESNPLIRLSEIPFRAW